jgi:16S rRNA (adenine1518-N6/adenine1519-N6)-dimethyltransferase
MPKNPTMSPKQNHLEQNLKPDKSLGQHFLHDKTVINAILESGPQTVPSPIIIEIGPGIGALTTTLVKLNPENFWAVEKDPRMVNSLRTNPELQILPSVRIIESDALKWDFENFYQGLNATPNIWLVGNLPYNVSAPLSVLFLRWLPVKHMTLMYQEEVAQKIITEKPSEMNSLKALTNSFFKVTSLIKVGPGAFHPPPKVESRVLFFERIEDAKLSIPLAKIDQYEKFLRALFQFPRKMIPKGLLTLRSKEFVELSLGKLGISSKIRAETLSLKNVQDLFWQFQIENKIEDKIENENENNREK